MMKSLEHLAFFLASHARGAGKTKNLADLVKKLDGTLIVRSEAEAKRCREQYGVKAISYQTEMHGKRFGVTYVDPDAVAQIMFSILEAHWECMKENQKLEKKVAQLKAKLANLHGTASKE